MCAICHNPIYPTERCPDIVDCLKRGIAYWQTAQNQAVMAYFSEQDFQQALQDWAKARDTLEFLCDVRDKTKLTAPAPNPRPRRPKQTVGNHRDAMLDTLARALQDASIAKKP